MTPPLCPFELVGAHALANRLPSDPAKITAKVDIISLSELIKNNAKQNIVMKLANVITSPGLSAIAPYAEPCFIVYSKTKKPGIKSFCCPSRTKFEAAQDLVVQSIINKRIISVR